MRDALNGKYRLLYLSPETSCGGINCLLACQKVSISMFAIDEAHCIFGVGARVPPGISIDEPAAPEISGAADCRVHGQRNARACGMTLSSN